MAVDNSVYTSEKPSVNLITQLQANSGTVQQTKPTYGIDSPAGLAASLPLAPLYLYATLKGKHDFWDAQLATLPDEAFTAPSIDLGCGRGLVLLKVAARKRDICLKQSRSPSGGDLAYGVDIFSKGDQSGNSPENTYNNARALNLLDHVVLNNASFAETLPFSNSTFSLVTASLSLHNVDKASRRSAMKEIDRICKPGGTVLILDLTGYVSGYHTELERAGWTCFRAFGGLGVVFGSWPTQILKATKPDKSYDSLAEAS